MIPNNYQLASVPVSLAPDQVTPVHKGLDYGQIMVARIQAEYSLAYRQDPRGFVADQWFPLVEAKFISGLYPKWSKETFFTDYVGEWNPGSALPQGDLKIDPHGSFVCKRYACETTIADDIPFVADPGIDPVFATTEFLTGVMQLHKERVLADAYFQSAGTGGTNVWGTNVSGVTSGENNSTTFRRFDDYANSSPRDVFRVMRVALKEKTGIMPNTAVMGEQVFEVLRTHPQLIQWYQTGANTIRNITELNETAMAQALGIDKIMVGRAMYNHAKPGDTVDLRWIFGKHIWLGYVDTPGPMKAISGMNLSFNQPLGGFDTAFTTVPDLRTHAQYNQAFQCYCPVIVGADFGAMVANIIS